MKLAGHIGNIIGIVFSIVFLYLLHGFVSSYEQFPMLMFWFAAELVAFADGVSLYNMVVDIRRRNRAIAAQRAIAEQRAEQNTEDALPEHYSYIAA